ncbi:unnamed protein product [Staurois parvus]|uniref:BED-type domain-containing protein n=1 Tax=Staurois parvus TaxID=386267 RepID=A0ABN9API2_9NEOB|nr:unnamed protein product [Staurois parvus]
MSDNMQRSGRGGNVLGASRRGSRGRGRGSTSRSQRPVLPVSSSGRVSTDNPAIIDWLARSSSSSQVTSDTCSQRSVCTSDTTVSWHGPGASPLKSRVLYLPLSFAVPSPSEVSHAVGSAPLYSEEELTEGGQERGETSASSAARRRSTGEESGSVAGLETGLSPDPHAAEGASSEAETLLDDEEVDRTWQPRRHQAISSASSGEEGASLAASKTVGGLPRRQQGRSSVSGGKRPRSRAPAPLQPTTTASSGAGAHGGSSSQPVRSSGGKVSYSVVWQFFVKPPKEVNVAVCRLCGQKVKRGQGAHVGTTALRQHMQRRHLVAWENRDKDTAVLPAPAPAPSPAPLLAPSPDVNRPLSASQGSKHLC